MFRIWCLLIGYACGNFLTAEVVTRQKTGKSAFAIGTGNPGMANVMAQCGFVAGIVTLAGDLAKTSLACVLCRWVFFRKWGILAAAYAGIGVCLGHDFPIWHHFRGGKSVATTCAAIFWVNPIWGLVAMVIGMVVVFVTKYLSIGAVVIPAAFAAISFMLYHSAELTGVMVALTLLMFCRHFENLRNIPKGTEPQTDVIGLIKEKTRQNHQTK